MGKRNLDSGENKEEKKEEKRRKTIEGSPKMFSCGEEAIGGRLTNDKGCNKVGV